MKREKIYPFFILAFLLMSFIITYGSNEGKFRNYVFAEILEEEKTKEINIKTEDKPSLQELEYEIQRSVVEYETKIIYNDEQYVDYKKLVQEGRNGMKRSVCQEYYDDGEMFLRPLEEEIIYLNPIDEIIEVGTKEYTPVEASRSGFRNSNEMDMVATAYDLSYASTGKNPGDPYYGITASGTEAQPGTVAVDPSVIPLGTKLYIASIDGSPDYGYATALDTGSAIKGYRVDLFMENNQDAMNFGIRQVKVYILD